jgi:hypothetical protein
MDMRLSSNMFDGAREKEKREDTWHKFALAAATPLDQVNRSCLQLRSSSVVLCALT